MKNPDKTEFLKYRNHLANYKKWLKFLANVPDSNLNFIWDKNYKIKKSIARIKVNTRYMDLNEMLTKLKMLIEDGSPICHPNRKHYAHGLCMSCWVMKRQKTNKTQVHF